MGLIPDLSGLSKNQKLGVQSLLVTGLLISLGVAVYSLGEPRNPFSRAATPTPQVIQNCTDSDGGVNYSVAGSCSNYVTGVTKTDSCWGELLFEYNCQDAGQGQGGYYCGVSTYNCKQSEGKFCVDGRCMVAEAGTPPPTPTPQATQNCQDTDNGFYYYTQGTCSNYATGATWTDWCLGNAVIEHGCVDQSEGKGGFVCIPKSYDCTTEGMFCNEGRCLISQGEKPPPTPTPLNTQNCTDSDGGIYYYTQGTCSNYVTGASWKDWCLGDLLMEHACVDAGAGQGGFVCSMVGSYNCSQEGKFCVEGRCVLAENVPSPTPTPTPSEIGPSPTATPTASVTPTGGRAQPTQSPTPTPTPIPGVPTDTPTPSPTPTPRTTPILPGAPNCLLADINQDGKVNAQDVTFLMSNWGLCPPNDPRADLNSDGCTDALDASILMLCWTG